MSLSMLFKNSKLKTQAIGRNGISKCMGFSFYRFDRGENWEKNFSEPRTVIQIQPINSRGDGTRCQIEIPLEEVQVFVDLLLAVKEAV